MALHNSIRTPKKYVTGWNCTRQDEMGQSGRILAEVWACPEGGPRTRGDGRRGAHPTPRLTGTSRRSFERRKPLGTLKNLGVRWRKDRQPTHRRWILMCLPRWEKYSPRARHGWRTTCEIATVALFPGAYKLSSASHKLLTIRTSVSSRP